MGPVLLLVLVYSMQETSQSSFLKPSFVVGIAYRFDPSVSPFCAGTLVANRWVVTSASCVSSDRNVIKKGKLVVGFGANGRQDVSRVEKVIKHKDYSQDKGGSTVHGNIALLKLKPDIIYRYRSACLPKLKRIEKAGDRILHSNAPNDKSLRRNSFVTFKYEKKKTKTKKSAKKRQSSQDLRLLGWRLNPLLPGALSYYREQLMVEVAKCRGKINKRLCISAASCEGDYGAPLIQGEETLRGVSITDMQVCKRYHQQTVFTDVRRYTKWIAKKIANNGGEKLCFKLSGRNG